MPPLVLLYPKYYEPGTHLPKAEVGGVKGALM